MKSQKLKILVCDDHELIREGLKRIILDRGLASAVGDACNAHGTMTEVRREKWDVVILDINLGGRNGMEVLKELKAEFPRLPVLILSAYPEEQFALRAIRAGASGYLNKNLAAEMLVEAIPRVLRGEHYLSMKVAEQLAQAVLRTADEPRHAALSDREDQVLRLIAAGLRVGEIAARLNLSVKTVSTYRGIALRKLGLSNNAQLMRYAQDHGLLE